MYEFPFETAPLVSTDRELVLLHNQTVYTSYDGGWWFETPITGERRPVGLTDHVLWSFGDSIFAIGGRINGISTALGMFSHPVKIVRR